jgi:hypothetical protein
MSIGINPFPSITHIALMGQGEENRDKPEADGVKSVGDGEPSSDSAAGTPTIPRQRMESLIHPAHYLQTSCPNIPLTDCS